MLNRIKFKFKFNFVEGIVEKSSVKTTKNENETRIDINIRASDFLIPLLILLTLYEVGNLAYNVFTYGWSVDNPVVFSLTQNGWSLLFIFINIGLLVQYWNIYRSNKSEKKIHVNNDTPIEVDKEINMKKHNDEKCATYTITDVAVEYLEDYDSWFVSLICDGEDSTGTPQELVNFARFTYRDDAIEYAVKIHVNDNVKLALIENDTVIYYEKEQAIKLMEDITNDK